MQLSRANSGYKGRPAEVRSRYLHHANSMSVLTEFMFREGFFYIMTTVFQ